MATQATMDLSEFMAWAASKGRALASLDFTKPLRDCRQAIVSTTKENFTGGHGPDGRGWPPLKHGRPGGKQAGLPLRDKGLLMASIISAGRGHIETLTPTTLVVGTNLEYAAIHQYGGTITPKGHPFLAIPQTREAQRAGGAKNFPRPLVAVIGQRGGVLLEKRTTGKGRRAKVKDVVQYILTRRVVIPARPFLGLGQKLIDRFGTIFRDFVTKKMGKG